MIHHLLTEPDVDAFRTALLDAGEFAAVKLLDEHRSASFLRRAAEKSGLSKVLPTVKPAARKALGLRLTR